MQLCPIYEEEVLPNEDGACSLCEGRLEEDGSCTTLLSEHEVLQRIVDIMSDDGKAEDDKIFDIHDNIARIDHRKTMSDGHGRLLLHIAKTIEIPDLLDKPDATATVPVIPLIDMIADIHEVDRQDNGRKFNRVMMDLYDKENEVITDLTDESTVSEIITDTKNDKTNT